MGRTAKHKPQRNDSDTKPPSVFAEMPTISLLEAVVTKDPRWHWLEAAWDASDDESVRELAEFVREHRATHWPMSSPGTYARSALSPAAVAARTPSSWTPRASSGQ